MKDSGWSGAEVAVVGMAGRFPDAKNVDAFWANVRDGKEAVRFFSPDELRARGVPEDLARDPDYVAAGAVLDDIDRFDAGFFGMSPRDASIMDPQHRFFLETTWEALEHAGCDPSRFDGAIGVFGGSGMNTYMIYHLAQNQRLMASAGEFLVRHTGNDKDFLTTRASYEFDLKGPSVNVQTACSTSLVAVHLAVQSLLTGECDLALAGGVTIELSQGRGYLYQPGEILAPDGHCRAFDAAAAGTHFGSGCGVVALKRLEDALRDGDTIHALVLGSAVNNDGRMKVGYMAPSVDGQAAVIAEALSVSGVEPGEISYVEAHGTGTPVGDPIEVAALTQAFRESTDAVGTCGIGSVKTNIGHLDTAAGIASLIKTTQALKHQTLPPTLHFTSPNPKLGLESSPFYVVDTLRPWATPEGQPRRAGISSLGVGGTNAHVVLQEPPPLDPTGPSRSHQLLCLSAKTDAALDRARHRLADYLRANPEAALADVAYSLQTGRKRFGRRAAVVATNQSEAAEALMQSGTPDTERAEASSAAFLFAGGGAQHPGMGRDLYDSEPVYRAEVNRGLAALQARCGLDLRPVLFPSEAQQAEAEQAMRRPLYALPALLLTQVALARQWSAWGVAPSAMIGHSLGEYTAATLAGVWSLEDALALVTERGRLFETLPPGGMMSVPLSEARLQPYMHGGLSVAAVNAPDLCVLAGTSEDLDALDARLAADGIEARRLSIDVAAHSSLVEAVLEPFRSFVAGLPAQPPQIPFASNLTGDWITADEATSADYWVRHLRETVRFADGARLLLGAPDQALVEVGPGRTLATLAQLHPVYDESQTVLTSMRHPKDEVDDRLVLLKALGELWKAGLDIAWDAFYTDERRRRIPLPTYSFERERHWIERATPVVSAGAEEADADEPSPRRAEIADWFEVPVWARSSVPQALAVQGQWLVVGAAGGPQEGIAAAAREQGAQAVSATFGAEFSHDEGRYTLQGTAHDAEALVTALIDNGHGPDRVVYVDAAASGLDDAHADVFMNAFHLARALGQRDPEAALHFDFVTTASHAVDGDTVTNPAGALLLGPARVLPKEFPAFTCRFLDVEAGLLDQPAVLAAVLATRSEPDSAVQAYRSGVWWQPELRTERLFGVDPSVSWTDNVSTVLITGGLGGLGLTLAEHLADRAPVKLALMGRRSLPPRETWDDWLANHPASEATAKTLRDVQALEAAGAEVLVLQADVADRDALARALAEARSQLGRIDTVVHAAGVLDDAPLLLKDAASAERVLAPKVAGTVNLHHALADDAPDRFLLFSSTSATLGLAGQIDYASANAFLNAFAEAVTEDGTTVATAVNWGVWRDVGMAAALIEDEGEHASAWDVSCDRTISHPLFDRWGATDTGAVFHAELSPETHWVLDEHRLADGHAVLPGTAYLELARAAVEVMEDSDTTVLERVTFFAPCFADEHVDVRVVLTSEGEGSYDFAVVSRPDHQTVVHAAGSLAASDVARLEARDIELIRSACHRSTAEYDAAHPLRQQEESLQLGPRWQCVRSVWMGDEEALASLALPSEYATDAQVYGLHPALLDMATGFALPLATGYTGQDGLFVPLTYERLTLWESLPSTLYGHVRLVEESAEGMLVRFDISLLGEEGRVLGEVAGLTMKRVESEAFTEIPSTSTPRGGIEALLSQGIRSSEGMEALDRVMHRPLTGPVVVSPLSVESLALQSSPEPRRSDAAVEGGPGASARDEYEQFLMTAWQELLGLNAVHPDDNFFDLGGHSLLAVRLFGRISRAYGKDLGLAALFEAPTLRQLASLIRGGEAAEDEQSARRHLVLIEPGEQGERPFYCVHGAGGNVLNFRDLAVRIHGKHPFYGLQARGADGADPPHKTIEAMASAYLEEVRDVQPEGPYRLGGYSGGGVIAFEMAHQLLAAGEDVEALVFLDTFRPGLEAAPNRRWALLQSVLSTPGGFASWRQRRAEYAEWEERKAEMERRLEAGESLPIDLREIQLTAAYHDAADQYTLRPLPCRATLLAASERHPDHAHIGPDLGWDALVADLDIQHIPGNHDNLVRDPNVDVLAERLRACLEGPHVQSLTLANEAEAIAT